MAFRTSIIVVLVALTGTEPGQARFDSITNANGVTLPNPGYTGSPLKLAANDGQNNWDGSWPAMNPQFYAEKMAKLTNMTALHRAALEGRKDVVESLLGSSNAQVDARTAYGDTPLDMAALKGHRDIVELLLSKGADVNAKSREGFTPLFMATVEGHKDVVELLLAKGANPSAKTDTDWTPLHMAAAQGAEFIVSDELGLMRDVQSNHFSTLCHLTPGTAYKEVVKLLLDKGLDVNEKCSSGSSFYLAVIAGRTDIVELMINNKADINDRESLGSTPLSVAAASGYKSIVELLLAHHADIQTRDTEGRTVLFGAARHNFKDVVELLLAAGVDDNAKDRAGLTPLDYVVDDKVGKDMEDLLRPALHDPVVR